MTRKVGVVGSSTFPLDIPVGTQVVETLRLLGDDVVFLTRGSGPFEQFLRTAALIMGRRLFEYPGKGGVDNLDRDDELVADCDEVIAFLDAAVLDESRRVGAVGVVTRALAAGKPTRVATAVDSNLVWAES